MKIKTIAHFADIHIENNKREEEYLKVFDNTYTQLEEDQPDIIALVGDLFDNFIQISNEAKIMAGNFLTRLAAITPVIITRGNHDMLRKNMKRVDSVKSLVEILNNPRIFYLDQTAMFKLPIADNIVWVVWNHGDGKSPWEKGFKKDKGHTYIDLYHDPIHGAQNFNGQGFKNNKLPGVKDFKGDYSFFGDIHKRQFFAKNTKAYCGSILQRDHGESLEGHGYLLWDIETGEVTERDIPNDWSFMDVKVNRFSDYDNLDLIEEYPKTSEYVKVRVVWESFPADQNLLNENKITAHVEKHYGVTPTFSKQIISEDDIKLYAEGVDGELTQDALNVVFREYLEANGYEEDAIEDVLVLDDLIQKRLNLPKKETVHYKLVYIEAQHFRGYGHFELDYRQLGKVVKVDGLNQVGKTTMFNALSYLYYGTTPETRSSRKFGDLRFINNKMNVNYCWVKGIIDINGELYGMKRQTTVTYKKNGEVSKCPTTLEFYGIKDGRLDEENVLTEAKKTETQKVVASIIGSYDDFIRTTMTTADTLNEILSVDRSVFIDAILRDAGLDEFEKKLEEFKGYRKEKINQREILPLNGPKAQEHIEINNNEIFYLQNDLTRILESIKEERVSIKNEEEKRSKLVNQYKAVDEVLLNTNPADIQQEINTLGFDRRDIEEQQNNLHGQIAQLPESFNRVRLDKLLGQKEAYGEFTQKKNYLLKDLQYKVMEAENDLNRFTTEQNRLSTTITDHSNRVLEYFKNYIINLRKEREHKSSIILKDIQNLENEIKNYLKEIDSWQKSKVCLTCNRPLDENDQVHISNKIAEIKKMVEERNSEIGTLQLQRQKLGNAIERLNTILNEYRGYNEETILKYCADVETKNSIIALYTGMGKTASMIESIEVQKSGKIVELSGYRQEEETIKAEMNRKAEAMEKVMLGIANEEKEEARSQERLLLIEKIKYFPVQLENIDLKIKGLQEKLELQRLTIETNKFNIALRKEVADCESLISAYHEAIQKLTNQVTGIEHHIADLERRNVELLRVITIYEEQLKEDGLFDIYTKCINRNGVPMLLLKKSVATINFHLSNLLSNVDFIAYFDEEMELKMCKKGYKEAVQEATGCSGKERTFISCALKLALREINKTAKGNLFLLDEITGKLVENSVDEFKDFLIKAQDLIEHIFIIEHTHPIDYDSIIMVTEKNGISSLEVVT